MSLLLPRLLLEARIIQNGLLPRGEFLACRENGIILGALEFLDDGFCLVVAQFQITVAFSELQKISIYFVAPVGKTLDPRLLLHVVVNN